MPFRGQRRRRVVVPIAAGETALANACKANQDVYVKGSGNIEITASVAMAQGCRLFGEGGAGVVSNGAFTIQPDSNCSIEGLNFEGTGTYGIQTASTPTVGVVVRNCVFNGINLRVLQATGGQHKNVTLEGNYLNGSEILVERMTHSLIRGNIARSTAGLRPIQLYGGQYITIDNNEIYAGTTGILCLYHTTIVGSLGFQYIVIQDNHVEGVTEESISFDVRGSEAALMQVREYDTVSSTSGSNQVILADADWAAQTTYNGGGWYLGFITGALIGQYFLVSAHNGATFTLSGITSEQLSSVQAGDQIWVGAVTQYCEVKRNTIQMPNETTIAGIVLYGQCFNNTIGGASGDGNTITNLGAADEYGILLRSLDGLAAGGDTGNQRRSPVDRNTVSWNTVTGALCGESPLDFGGIGGMFSVSGNTFSNNTVS